MARNAEGKPHVVKLFCPKWSLVGIDLNILVPLRKRARKMGAKTLNKVQVVDLLRQKGRVVGAVGFNIIDLRFYIFKSKSTILANGSCNYKVERMWSSANGDGIAAAYRAGTEMRNAEFGSFYDILIQDQNSPAVGSQAFIYMALCAEMTYRSALMRGESRGWHYREDYQKRDDADWLKWIIVKEEQGKMTVSTEPVPINKYIYKP